jgi:hypothetical protein
MPRLKSVTRNPQGTWNAQGRAGEGKEVRVGQGKEGEGRREEGKGGHGRAWKDRVG